MWSNSLVSIFFSTIVHLIQSARAIRCKWLLMSIVGIVIHLGLRYLVEEIKRYLKGFFLYKTLQIFISCDEKHLSYFQNGLKH